MRRWWIWALTGRAIVLGAVAGTVMTWLSGDRLWGWDWAFHWLRWTVQLAAVWAAVMWMEHRKSSREAARAAARRREIEEGWSRGPLPPGARGSEDLHT
ncbi:hypothetical protein G5C51_33400 [Streptomyces sp. A7024]|uniref:Uncharacterized protein n=1 Tax=Streptomyces coryli TaxID=1128680 RepID=A0A6G4U960_9ACTN|nr:hypothetical protein [Streptomyces coryli]NGN68775.1 hypothetical protein [Streptomyces coryli]